MKCYWVNAPKDPQPPEGPFLLSLAQEKLVSTSFYHEPLQGGFALLEANLCFVVLCPITGISIFSQKSHCNYWNPWLQEELVLNCFSLSWFFGNIHFAAPLFCCASLHKYISFSCCFSDVFSIKNVSSTACGNFYVPYNDKNVSVTVSTVLLHQVLSRLWSTWPYFFIHPTHATGVCHCGSAAVANEIPPSQPGTAPWVGFVLVPWFAYVPTQRPPSFRMNSCRGLIAIMLQLPRRIE